MDTFLFTDLSLRRGEPPTEVPMNNPRILVLCQSIWLNADHYEHPPCRFDDYLAIRGWDEEKLKIGRFRDAHEANIGLSDDECVMAAIAVIQSWMTLGFLEDLFQDRALCEKYIVKLEPTKVAMLHQLVKDPAIWERATSKVDDTVRIFNTSTLVYDLLSMSSTIIIEPEHSRLTSSHVARLPRLLRSYTLALSRLLDIDHYDEERDQTTYPIDPDVECGMWLRNQLLFPNMLIEVVEGYLSKHIPEHENITQSMWDDVQTSHLTQGLKWCPFTLFKLRENTSRFVIHWLWASGFPALCERDHSTCTEDVCTASRVKDETDYPEAHVEGCVGGCGKFVPDSEIVKSALDANLIPLIIARVNPDSSIGYNFETSQSAEAKGHDEDYIAFSHVWADGFGSCTEQGIPYCQAKHLAEASFAVQEETNETVSFWIDSLCIPKSAELRKKAIRLMAQTYHQAKSVIALDKALQKVSKHSSPELLLLRVYTAPWMNRVWTYQEAVLAKQLYFKLSDGYCVLNFSMSVDGKGSPLALPVFFANFSPVHRWLRQEVASLNGEMREVNIAFAALELRWRDTLHRDPNGKNDELLALGTILGIDTGRLLELQGEQRMIAFLTMARTLYRNIIFAEAPRLSTLGFRWALNTFLVRDTRRPVSDLDGTGVICTENGLIGDYVVFDATELGPIHVNRQRRVTVRDKSFDPPRWYDILVGGTDSYDFDYIITYPVTAPESVKGTIFVAALARSDTEMSRSLLASDPQYANVSIVAAFQTVTHLCVLRDWEFRPEEKFPEGFLVVDGRLEKRTVLLR